MSKQRSGTLTNPWLARAFTLAIACCAMNSRGNGNDQLALAEHDTAQWWQWQLNGERTQGTLPPHLLTPLGSLWKLFVFIYLVDTHQPEQKMLCDGQHPAEDRYCCEPQQSVDRSDALSRSCGRYFSPARLHIDPVTWRSYWSQRSAPEWLSDLHQLDEHQLVTVTSLLQLLANIPAEPRQQAKAALIGNNLQGRGRDALPTLGTLAIVKTFTQPLDGTRLGGGAGWTQNDVPIWFSGSGNSQQVMHRLAPQLAKILLARRNADNSCVRVHFFARYPLQSVEDSQGKRLAAVTQPLAGHYTFTFTNGQQLTWQSGREPFWLEADSIGQLALYGRLSETEYVARVVDREGKAPSQQAAQALAVAARSYLYQHARYQGECLSIDDTSALQRVSSLPASVAALSAARITSGLQLSAVTVQYHQHQGARNRLSWQQALAWQEQGLDFVQILARAYPDAHLTWRGAEGHPECQPLQEPAHWLKQQLITWQSVLDTLPGYEAIALPQICLLHQGRPYADQKAQRIYLRPATTLDSRITLTHEYLHLALAHHPAGADETYIEQLARRLVRGEL